VGARRNRPRCSGSSGGADGLPAPGPSEPHQCVEPGGSLAAESPPEDALEDGMHRQRRERRPAPLTLLDQRNSVTLQLHNSTSPLSSASPREGRPDHADFGLRVLIAPPRDGSVPRRVVAQRRRCEAGIFEHLERRFEDRAPVLGIVRSS